jgi:hypothetical protein
MDKFNYFEPLSRDAKVLRPVKVFDWCVAFECVDLLDAGGKTVVVESAPLDFVFRGEVLVATTPEIAKVVSIAGIKFSRRPSSVRDGRREYLVERVTLSPGDKIEMTVQFLQNGHFFASLLGKALR